MTTKAKKKEKKRKALIITQHFHAQRTFFMLILLQQRKCKGAQSCVIYQFFLYGSTDFVATFLVICTGNVMCTFKNDIGLVGSANQEIL